jgi:phospholipid-translocating ATPase
MAKILCAGTFALSVLLVALNGFRGQWYVYVFRFLILFSSIIPIRYVSLLHHLFWHEEEANCATSDFVVVVRSLRVNLDMGKTVYAHAIQTDHEIPNTIVRTSTLPEELGRIEYLLSDKVRCLHSHLRARVRLLTSMWPER